MKIFIIFLFVSCAHHTEYPEHWWDGVAKSELKWWEISPDSADEDAVVLSKRNELGILSNFAATPFEFNGEFFPNVEAFWQSLKYPENENDPRFKRAIWPFTRSEVKKMNGFAAKDAGDKASKIMKELGINYVTYKGEKMDYRVKVKGAHYSLIKSVMSEKWLQNPKVQEVLEKTRGLKLLPDHHVGKDAPPAWRYYEIWMELRDSLPDTLPELESAQ